MRPPLEWLYSFFIGMIDSKMHKSQVNILRNFHVSHTHISTTQIKIYNTFQAPPERSLVPLTRHHTPPRGWHLSWLLHHRLALLLLDLHIHRIMQDVPFCVWPLFLNTMFLTFIYVLHLSVLCTLKKCFLGSIPLYEIPQLVCPFFHWETFRWFLVWGYHEYSLLSSLKYYSQTQGTTG